ncbi:Zn-dependent exopeptidase [Crepidotus variabilis]|uniref:Zn-dependent exopeptidase n=1 Tax=Crepidotus variabilis TaxID=179855 RepID=A0A9P6JVY7_9AGAR|nr:Zn-dependent exopeptidase [Crepidotus variabilis]
MNQNFTSPIIPHPSLSRELQSESGNPVLVHSLHEAKSSVLSLAATDEYIFSGNQNEEISVWNKTTFQLKCTLRGHTGSVLDLEYAPDKNWLFSSSGDSTIRVWSTETLEPLYLIDPYLETGAGDLFSLTWSSTLQTIYVGCQNTSLQWFSFKGAPPPTLSSNPTCSTPSSSPPTISPSVSRKAHKFFDSYPQYERRAADIHANNGVQSGSRTPRIPGRGSPDSTGSVIPHPKEFVAIPPENVIDSAHYGYIYCMTYLREGDKTGVQIATGSGDETVKVWSCKPDNLVPELVHEFSFSHGAVLALVAKGDTIYAGCQDGYVKVLDLETKTLVRTIIVQEGVDILAMSRLGSDLYTCSANGWIKRWSSAFDCTASWKAHDGISLSSLVTKRSSGEFCLVTGGNDDHINVWDVKPPKVRVRPTEDEEENKCAHSCIGTGTFHDTMIYALSKFITIPSISSDPAHREDCRQSAIWLRKCLGQLGAHTHLLPTGEGNNPIVLATFKGSINEKPKRRILFYGHYDVISAPFTPSNNANQNTSPASPTAPFDMPTTSAATPALSTSSGGWTSDAFTLTGRNGYLYGRGATDNKGPIIAVACAAADLLSRRALEVDLVFLVEGEEEFGSTGFEDSVEKHKDLIGDIDAILVSNSTWIGDDRPCITYGLRGVIRCGLQIVGPHPDLHSGVEGGAVAEPMMDMVKLLATLTEGDRTVRIPGFYDAVRPQTDKEKESYKLLSEVTQRPASLLSSRWREPSLTVHNVEISGPKNATVIPACVKAQISIRIVPDQDLDTIVKALQEYLQSSFDSQDSPNSLKFQVEHTADWWLGDLEDHWFKSLESAVQEEWGVAPLQIREGGSIPSVPYLEKVFKCHALHLPMGQSSDQAHLPDERISLVNLQKGKAVVERFLVKVAQEV